MGNVKKIVKWIFFGLLILLAFFTILFLLDKALKALENKYGESKKFEALTPVGELITDKNNNEHEYIEKNNNKENTNSVNANNSNTKNTNSILDKMANLEYEPVYMDDVILLYDGKQSGKSISDLIDRLIENTEQTLFSYVGITTKGISSADKSVFFEDADSYISSLNSIKNSINKESYYNVSFKYNPLGTHVTEIIIEPKK